MAGFEFKYTLHGNDYAKERLTIDNSQTLVVGDVVKLTTYGVCTPCTAGDAEIVGIVMGFEDNNGLPLEHPAADYDGTYTSGGVGTGTYVAASDNESDKYIKAVVNADPWSVYSNATDGTFGTTTGNDGYGALVDLIDKDEINEDHSHSITTSAQFMCLGADPNDSTKGLFKVHEHIYFSL